MKTALAICLCSIIGVKTAFAQLPSSYETTALSDAQKAEALALWAKLTDQQKRFVANEVQRKRKKLAGSSASLTARLVDPAIVPKDPARAAPPPGFSIDVALDCGSQQFFLRRDRFDVFSFMNPCGPSDELGASVSATVNELAKTANVTAQGWTGYVLSPPNANYAVGPSVYATGNFADPFKQTTERSAIRGAIENEFAGPEYAFVSRSTSDTPVVLTSFVDLAPYVQTDFRGLGRIAGFDALFEPYIAGLHLGGRDDINSRELVGIYWRIEPEIDLIHIWTPGLTNFVANSNHEFFGGTLRTNMILFQNMPEVGQALCGRVYVSGTGQYFGDAQGKALSNFSAEIGYYLGAGVAPYWRKCSPLSDGALAQPTPGATSSSISFVFSDGTDKTTLVNQRQYKVQLNIKY